MRTETADKSESPERFWRIEPQALATIFGLISAFGYTCANICLRSVSDLDPVWVSCMKALPMVLVAVPIMLTTAWQARTPVVSNWRIFWLISGVAVIGQIFGNVLFQIALRYIGLAMAVPVTLGAMIVSGAFMGKWFLNDALTRRMLFAGIVLIGAICVLSFGASTEPNSTQNTLAAKRPDEKTLTENAKRAGDELVQNSPVDYQIGSYLSTDVSNGRWQAMLGCCAACAAGFAYCCLSIVIRYSTNRGTSMSSLLGIVGVVGILGLGGLTLATHGLESIVAPTLNQNLAMFLAGVFNCIAFWVLIRALQLATVFFVNALNVSQIAMAATAGSILFGESVTVSLMLGILLTTVGLMMMKKD